MIPLLLAAAVITGLGDRPAALLGADGKDGYLAKLEQKLDMPGLNLLVATAIPNCPDLTYVSSDYRELPDQDMGQGNSFYGTFAVRPAIEEHIQVKGCGKQLQLNFTAARLQANPTELKFSFQIVGKTKTDLQLRRDAYVYVALANDAARTLAGQTAPCGQTVMVYDTELKTEPNGNAPWDEIWYTAKCDFRTRVLVNFIPKANGGTTIGAHAIGPAD